MFTDRSNRSFHILLAVMLPFLTLGSRPHSAVPSAEYSVTDLRPDICCDNVVPTAVNDAGWVVGYTYPTVIGVDSFIELPHPFAWHAGSLKALTTFGGAYGKAKAINVKREIAGYADNNDNMYETKPAIWSKSPQFVPTALSVLSGRARCLLDDGTAGGDVYRSGRVWAAVWKAGKVTLLGNSDDRISVCTGINLDGTAVGYCAPGDQKEVSSGDPEERGNRKAYLWRAGRHTMFPGLGGLVSECTAINDSGTVVGWADTKDGRRAFQWNPDTISVLPSTEKARYCEAHSINKHGVIVGDCRTNANDSTACIWRNGGIEELNKLIPANSGWRLIQATHISDNGLIVGCGIHSRDPKDGLHAFLLTPVSSGIH